MTEEVKARLAEIYKNMRKASNNNNGIAIGTRQLEALVRLTVAHAKLLMKTETDISDVECVEGLFNSMFKEFGIDIKQGSFNQNVFYTSSKMYCMGDKSCNRCGKRGLTWDQDFHSKTGKWKLENHKTVNGKWCNKPFFLS